MKNELRELYIDYTKGENKDFVLTHNHIIDILLTLDEDILKEEIVILRNQMQGVIDKCKIDLNI